VRADRSCCNQDWIERKWNWRVLPRNALVRGLSALDQTLDCRLIQTSRTSAVNHPEIIKLQKFLQQKFNNKNIDVRPRAKLNDSVEVFIGDESIGLIHLDDEDGDKSYMFSMSILDIDLEDIE
jgi:hypothetical protein